MQIQKGIVKYKDRSDINCMYGVTDDGKQYYFLDETDTKKFSNGNRIASTLLVEAIDPMVKASNVGVIDESGNVIISFDNKSIKQINDDIILVEKAQPVSKCVTDAIALKNDPSFATQLVSTPATIKERLNAKMGVDGRYFFNDQFSEATVCDINGNNLVNNEYFSFIGMGNGKLYFSKNTVDSEITEYSILPPEVQSDVTPTNDTNEIDVSGVEVSKDVVEGALTGNTMQDVVEETKEENTSDNTIAVTDIAPAVEDTVATSVPIAEEVQGSVSLDDIEIPSISADDEVENKDTINESTGFAPTAGEIPQVGDLSEDKEDNPSQEIDNDIKIALDDIETSATENDSQEITETVSEEKEESDETKKEKDIEDSVDSENILSRDFISGLTGLTEEFIKESSDSSDDTETEESKEDIESEESTDEEEKAEDASKDSDEVVEEQADEKSEEDNEAESEESTDGEEKEEDISKDSDEVTEEQADEKSEGDNEAESEESTDEEEKEEDISKDSDEVTEEQADEKSEEDNEAESGESTDEEEKEDDVSKDSEEQTEDKVEEDRSDFDDTEIELNIDFDKVNDEVSDIIGESINIDDDKDSDEEIYGESNDSDDFSNSDNSNEEDSYINDIDAADNSVFEDIDRDFDEYSDFDEAIFKDSILKADKIMDDYIDTFDSKDFDSVESDTAKDNIMVDVANSMANLIKQNKEQKNIINKYQEKYEKLSAARRSIADKAEIQEQKIEVLTSKIRTMEAAMAKLDSKNQSLESKVRDQDKLISAQAREIDDLRPQLAGKEDLVKVLADAQLLLGQDDSYSFDYGDSYPRI